MKSSPFRFQSIDELRQEARRQTHQWILTLVLLHVLLIGIALLLHTVKQAGGWGAIGKLLG